jgi:hypothetical protein
MTSNDKNNQHGLRAYLIAMPALRAQFVSSLCQDANIDFMLEFDSSAKNDLPMTMAIER